MIRRVRQMCEPNAPDGFCRPGQVRLEGSAKEAIETGRNRLVVAGALFALAFLLIGARLVDVAVISAPERAGTAAARHAGPTYRPVRAEILDRSGQVVAGNIRTYSLYADPARVVRPAETAERLAALFPDMEPGEILPRLTMANRRFVWLRRHVSPREYQAVIQMGLAGVGARQDTRRVYPQGPLLSHILGYTDVDNRGLAGVERYFNDALQDTNQRLRLSVDMRLQHIVRESLLAAVERHGAKGASGLIMNIRTGEILAMVSLPDFNPNRPDEAERIARFNRNTLGTYEMGSTFKIFNTAMAIEEGGVSLDDRYDAREPIQVSRFTIRDYHARREILTVREIFMYSSNIGSALIADQMGTETQRRFLGRLGLLRRASLELPEVASPQLPPHWRRINTLTIAFGHGLSVSPLQLATAVGGIANDGVMVQPTLIRLPRGVQPAGERVVSRRTSAAMRDLMRAVVEDGTGRRAAVEGIAIGGKTGTAEKPSRRGYQRNRLISSFVAVAPIDDPQYVILVVLDEPSRPMEGRIRPTGGRVAAPVVAEIVDAAAPFLGLAPGIVARGEEDDRVHQTAGIRIARREESE